jgi:CheY-like chemotaxis protein
VYTVLVLEDNDVVIDLMRRMLPAKGYSVLEARDQGEVIRTCQQYKSRIDLLIADQFLPGTTGAQTAAMFRSLRPGVPVLFVSATPTQFWSETDQQTLLEFPSGTVGFVQKPFLPATLLTEVEYLIRQNRYAGAVEPAGESAFFGGSGKLIKAMEF